MIRRWREVIFWGAALFAFVMATVPHPPPIPGNPQDKVLHVVTFVVLTVLAQVAYPEKSRVLIALALAGFGLSIEIVQAIPVLHREASVLDWLADFLAILASSAILFGARSLLGKLR